MKVKPMTPHFGADIEDIDLDTLSDEEFEEIYQAWLEWGVVRFRGQTLNEDGLQRFSQRFGPLEAFPGYDKLPDKAKSRLKNKYVTPLSNIKIDGKPIGGLGNAEAEWHSDMTYVEIPPPASVLLGVEIPPEGGDTFFADQRAAYQALPDTLKERIDGLSIKHSAAHDSVGNLRRGFEPFDDPRDAPGAVHSIVRRHDETGEACLYLGRRSWAYVPGLELDDSEALLDELWTHAALGENVVKQEWTPGDVITWDNRRCLHRRTSFDPDSRRLMLRCQVLARAA